MEKEVKTGVGLCILANLPGIIIVFLLAFFFVGLFGGSTPAAENTIGNCTSADIPKNELANMNSNMSVYKSAAITTNVPWEMLAAIHIREGSAGPNSSLISGRKIGTPEPDVGGKVYSSLQETANAAGQILQAKVGNKLTQTTTDPALIKDAFWKYNGVAYGSADNSPYVMSNFDAAHKDMPIIKVDHGKPELPGDTRNGTYTTFMILKGNCK